MGDSRNIPRERVMRKLLVLGSLSVGMTFPLLAHQRAAAPSFVPSIAAHTASAPSHVTPPAHATAPHSASANTTSSRAATANHQKPIPRPSPIIVPPVNSITTTTSCRRQFGSTGVYAGCPSPVVGAAFYGGAYYIPVPYYYTDAAAAEDLPPGPQDVEQLTANEQAVSRPMDQGEEGPIAAPSPSSSEINQALAEFVFVNRDGTKFNAVAYSFVNDKLQYVTKEGVRRTESIDSLDLDATQKLNEQLGNTINLPGPPDSGIALNVASANLN